jgi:hypothetical protein
VLFGRHGDYFFPLVREADAGLSGLFGLSGLLGLLGLPGCSKSGICAAFRLEGLSSRFWVLAGCFPFS